MITRKRPSNALLGGLCALALLLAGSSVPRAQSGNLPIYTSPIDATGLRLQLNAAAPHRDTQKRVDVTLPVGLLPPNVSRIFEMPLSTQMDQFWNVIRQALCDGPGGIKQMVAEVNSKLSGGVSVIVTCNFATTGKLLVRQVGSTMFLAYQLTNNSLTVRATTPGTCSPGKNAFCPDDPQATVTFAAQFATLIRTPSLCAISTEDVTASVQAPTIHGDTTLAAIGIDLVRLFGGQALPRLEAAITSIEKRVPLPINAAFNELRTSAACTGKTPGTSRVLSAFRELETQIDRQAIILRAVHVGIEAPSLFVPNPGAPSRPPSMPSFQPPMISTTQPLVTAGAAVQVRGQYFPPNINLASVLPVTLGHGGYGKNSTILGGGICLGGATELEWGPVGRPLSVRRLQGDAQGRCAPRYDAANLTPNTGYQFRARDCDPITCSPWSATQKVTTARTDPAQGSAIITLDNGRSLGTTTVNSQGTFQSSVTIPAGTSVGTHTIYAVSGGAKASVKVQVAASSPAGGSKALIMMVARLKGQTECPNNQITSTATDDTFMLFGAGFAPGKVTVRLDSATGAVLGTAAVSANGSFCQQMRGVPRNQAGAHTLLTVQNNNGAILARTLVTFVVSPVVR